METPEQVFKNDIFLLIHFHNEFVCGLRFMKRFRFQKDVRAT